MSWYRNIIIETYRNMGEPTNARIRARPIPGQGLDVSMKVECSRKMRESHPVGTKIKIAAKIIDKDGGAPFLYAHFNAAYEVLSEEEASAFVRESRFPEIASPE